MAITFKSKHSPNILTLDRIGLELIKAMGHSGSVPGSLAAADVGPAFAALKESIDRRGQDTGDELGKDDEPASVSFAHRALPLLGMLESAAREGDYVIWDR